MVIEALLCFTGYYLYRYYFKDSEFVKYMKLIDQLDIVNKEVNINNSIKLISYEKESDYELITIDISGVIGFNDLISKKDYLSTYFRKEVVDIKKVDNFYAQLKLK